MHVKFIQLYDAYFDDVYRYVYVKTGNKWDAEDLVSDIFRKAFEKRSSLAKHPNQKAWLFMIARNTIIDFYRKKKNVPIGDWMEHYVSPVDFEDPFKGRMKKNVCRKACPICQWKTWKSPSCGILLI
ncbi:RNA polymerase sigma factor [Sporosarcina sp. FSL W7-1349]|uniref:RNA polymerase sigma factor n=1 Tax=Sporosarcina sp. FSL W7-1349 TaxID=2921561 RepID=UPI0030F74D7B